jgi:hypothetical protein
MLTRRALAVLTLLATTLSPLASEALENQRTAVYTPLLTVYELQIRTANACRTNGGYGEAQYCAAKKYAAPITDRADVHPRVPWNPSCDPGQKNVRPGTIGDLLLDTKDIRDRVTLRYVRESVGASTVWLMPVHPNYEQGMFLPDRCDVGGSPYAATDFMHVGAAQSDTCIRVQRDEVTDPPCWGNNHQLRTGETLAEPASAFFASASLRKGADPDTRKSDFQALLDKAKKLGMRVMMDIALNHTGVDYRFYDYLGAPTYQQYANAAKAAGKSLDAYMYGLLASDTVEEGLIFPKILDSFAELTAAQVTALKAIKGCANASKTTLVVMQNLVNAAYDFEKPQLQCDKIELHYNLPAFYASASNQAEPSRDPNSAFHEWKDVLKLYYAIWNQGRMFEWVRAREYAFRILNYWVAQGARAFRLDHANGLHPEVWNYIVRKVRKYQALRARKLGIAYEDIVFFAEDFDNTKANLPNFDSAWVGEAKDIPNMVKKDASDIMGVLEGLTTSKGLKYRQDKYFPQGGWYSPALGLGLGNHDEPSVYTHSGMPDVWTAAAFHAVFTTSWGMPIMPIGQEWGEMWQIPFRRLDHLPSRWAPGFGNLDEKGKAALAAWYKTLHEIRTRRCGATEMDLCFPSLAYGEKYNLKTFYDTIDDRYLTYAKYILNCSETTFVMVNLWNQPGEQVYQITADLAGKICLGDTKRYRARNIFDGRNDWDLTHQGTGGIREGWEIKANGLKLFFNPGERVKILKLELVP